MELLTSSCVFTQWAGPRCAGVFLNDPVPSNGPHQPQASNPAKGLCRRLRDGTAEQDGLPSQVELRKVERGRRRVQAGDVDRIREPSKAEVERLAVAELKSDKRPSAVVGRRCRIGFRKNPIQSEELQVCC